MDNAQSAALRSSALDEERHRYTSLIPQLESPIYVWQPRLRRMRKLKIIAQAPANRGHVALFADEEDGKYTRCECVKIVPESYVELARRHPYDYSEQPLSDYAVCEHMKKARTNGTVAPIGVFVDPSGPPPLLEPAAEGKTAAGVRRTLELRGGQDDARVRTTEKTRKEEDSEEGGEEAAQDRGRSGRRASTGEHGRPGGERFYYMSTEYCPGGNLCDALFTRKDNAPVRREHLQRIAKHLLKCVQALHAHGFCHLDISPDNVLLAKRGNQLRYVLADFAQAQRLHILPDGGFQPVFGIRGKPPFRAPEVWKKYKKGYQGPPVDVYAVACVILLVAAYPYNTYVIEQHTKEDPGFRRMSGREGRNATRSVAHVLRSVGLQRVAQDKELIELLDSMMREEPEKRASVAECLDHRFLAPSAPTAGSQAGVGHQHRHM